MNTITRKALTKVFTKIMNTGDDFVKISVTKKGLKDILNPNRAGTCDGMTLWGAIDGPNVYEEYGRYLHELSNKGAKQAKKITIQSVPTQQYLDEILGVAKAEGGVQIAQNGYGYINPKRVMDAKRVYEGAKYTADGIPVVPKAIPVEIESKLTSDFINETFDFATADAYRKAQALGTELPETILRRREDAYEAFVNGSKPTTKGVLYLLKEAEKYLPNDYAKNYLKHDVTTVEKFKNLGFEI